MSKQAQARAGAPEPDGQPLRISLEGPPALVAQLITGMARIFSEQGDGLITQPDPILLTRTQAAARYGIHEDRLSALVRLGRLTNRGTPGKMRFSPADVQAVKQTLD